MKHISILLLVFCTCFALAAWPQARPQWGNKIVTFDPPGEAQGTWVGSISPAGWIAGWYVDSSSMVHGFLRDPHGNFTEIDVPGELGTAAGSFQKKWVVGGCSDSNLENHGFLRDPHDNFTEFDAPGAGQGGSGQGTYGGEFNVKMESEGFYVDSNYAYHGFLRGSGTNGTITDFDCLQAGTGSGQGTIPQGIDSESEIAGMCIDGNSVWHGFVRASDGTITDFDAPGSAGLVTYAGSINSGGWITGYYQDAKYVFHGYVRDPKGNITKFDVKGAGKGNQEGTAAFAINAAGIISGIYYDPENVGHGFVRDPNGKIKTFDIPWAGEGSGQWGPWGTYINDSGEIAGTYVDAKNLTHGFLRLP